MEATYREFDPFSLLPAFNAIERKNIPRCIYAAGDTALLQASLRVAIIGSRKASQQALERASAIAAAVVRRNGVVISGLAAGVDAAAHLGTLDAGGASIAVIGTNLDTFYPRENADLQKRLMTHHLVLSQFPPGYPTKQENFVLRNRTMALIAQASIIVAAGARSGTEHQGWEAIRLGRLLLLPSELVDSPFDWPRKMCNYGARTFSSVDELQAILDEELPTIPAEAIGAMPF